MAEKDDHDEIYKDFHDAVNMSASELKEYLQGEDSQRVGWKGGQGGAGGGEHEPAGHESGLHTLEVLAKEQSDLRPNDYAHMKKVTGYVHRHLSQRPGEDIADSNWRYSLMNWGHDPLKDK